MQQADRANDFLTAVEAAERLGVSDTAVRKWIASGSITANKHGREWRIPLPEVERLKNESNTPEMKHKNEPNEPVNQTNRTNPSEESSLRMEQLELENQHLRREKDAAIKRAVSTENRLQTALDSIQELTRQIDHLTQLLALAQKNVAAVIEQNQLLLEDTRKKMLPFWKRILGRGKAS